MTTPKTVAACALLELADRFFDMDPDDTRDAILAIEQEAADTQDARDGRALRLLREALPKRWYITTSDFGYSWSVAAFDDGIFYDDADAVPYAKGHGPTIAAACDAARAALEGVQS